ncbi:hypothetical protein [Leptospira ilyithenensis]|uniref:hypothetical protein n=1 Tax=Leptospira ilyithenensis TaxID=2484901 RepID=UPI001FEA4269|nr:hypothetical protein [Leptospira ilyithenensis]
MKQTNRNKISIPFLKQKLSISLVLLLSISLFAQCKKEKEEDNTGVLALLALANTSSTLTTTCATNADGTVDSTLSTPTKGSFSICKPASDTIKHYRVEGLKVSVSHLAFTIYAGFPANYTTAPTQTSTALTSGQFAFNFYSGSGTTFPVPGFSYASFGTSTKNLTNNGNTTTATPAGTNLYDFITATVDVCFDLTSASPPRFTVWVTGQNGAVCKTKTNLTLGTAVGTESSWGSSTSALATQNSYFGISSATGVTFTKIVSSPDSVLP